VGGERLQVLIAGGGVAALEAALTLKELGGPSVSVELLAPETSVWYRPAAVGEPFGMAGVRHFDLGRIADAVGAGLTLGALASVDPLRRRARTSAGVTFSYDALLIACGAVPTPAVPGALTFRGPADSERLGLLLDELERGRLRHLAFVAPWGAGWTLPIYEIALLAGEGLARRGVFTVGLTLVTPESSPLSLFGRQASDMVAALLEESGVSVVCDAYAIEARDGELLLAPDDVIRADRVVALPRLCGQRLDGVPQTGEGFVPVDRSGRVLGVEGVFAAGDVTSFPVKQGGIACQQAEAAAEAILEEAGLLEHSRPFEPVLRGLLVTGRGPRYLRHELSATPSTPDEVDELPLWWPPAKIAGRRLAPFLAALADGGVPGPPSNAISVERALDEGDVADRLTSTRLEPSRASERMPEQLPAVGDVMIPEPLAVPSHLTLEELAAMLRRHGAGSALVVDGDELVGILTARDLLGAMAAGIDPREALVRHWMTAEPVIVEPSATLGAAEALMAEYGVNHLPVVEGGTVVGVLRWSDVSATRRGARVAAVGLGF
jgi:sulfide:quinone oxidoreductase